MFEALDDGRVAADHQTKAQFEPPDPARCPLIDIVDAFGSKDRCTAHVIVEVRVAAVDDGVTGAEEGGQIVDHSLGGRTAWQHDPDGPRGRQCIDERLQVVGAHCAVFLEFTDRVVAPVVDDDAMSMPQPAPRHARTHTAETDDSDVHVRLLYAMQYEMKNRTSMCIDARFRNGAGDEIRTRDLNLGKVSLYQLSHSRT